MASSTLADIRQKVRRITRSPSEARLTTAQLDQYINTAIQSDMPQHLRLFPLRTNLTFYTTPGVDVYQTNTTNPTDPLFDFKNRYTAVHQPVFMAGVQSYYLQDRSAFYAQYPQTNAIADTLLRGNGGPGPFTGVVNARPMLQRNVIFTCLDTNNNSMVLVDEPTALNPAVGNLYVPDNIAVTLGTINYITGAFSFSFPANTLNGAIIWVENIPYQPGKPIMMLFFENKFTLRPVPDNAYSIKIEADIRPTELLNSIQRPDIDQWWQYIAWLASKKVFEDRMDMDSIQLITPELKKQEMLAQRSTLMIKANERTATVYTQGTNYAWGGWWGATWPY